MSGGFKVRLPSAIETDTSAIDLEEKGRWLVISDLHVPFHDSTTIEQAVRLCRRRTIVGILLNGDVLDFHGLSRFDKSPEDHRYCEEIKLGRQLMAYLRERFRKARIVYKVGNHEERLYTYLWNRAPELFGLDVLTIPGLLKLEDYGIEIIDDRRVVCLGKLNVVHGHEYRPGITTPVNPARGLFLRAKASALCGHFHQTSEHHEPTINGTAQGAWSVGCACSLSPRYMPLNRWNHGFAVVEVEEDDSFSVDNHRILDGRVV